MNREGSDFGRRRSRARRSCFVLALLGPDGVGKSSVLARVARDLSPTFDAVTHHHLRPAILGGSIRRRATSNPHSARGRGLLGSTAKLLYWWLEYWTGHLVSLGKRGYGSELVLFDRYCDDLTVDPERYRYRGPGWAARLLSAVVPRPDLMIVLDAAPEQIIARKQEIGLDAATRLRERYRALAESSATCHVVDANGALAETSDRVVQLVIGQLSARAAGRQSLPVATGVPQ